MGFRSEKYFLVVLKIQLLYFSEFFTGLKSLNTLPRFDATKLALFHEEMRKYRPKTECKFVKIATLRLCYEQKINPEKFQVTLV